LKPDLIITANKYLPKFGHVKAIISSFSNEYHVQNNDNYQW
jgi:hypothetical protein